MTPPASAAPAVAPSAAAITFLPSDDAQNHARPHYRAKAGSINLLMLLATAALWGAAWYATQSVLATPRKAISLRAAHTALPITAAKPQLLLALHEPTPVPTVTPRARQRVSADLTTLLGHVARSLLKDEFDTMVLRLSLGEQVVLHLHQSLQDQLHQPLQAQRVPSGQPSSHANRVGAR